VNVYYKECIYKMTMAHTFSAQLGALTQMHPVEMTTSTSRAEIFTTYSLHFRS